MMPRVPARARTIIALVIFLVFVTLPSYAQQFPQTERQKAEEDRERAQEARKKANERAIDEEYKSLMEQRPSANKKVDPWGGLRAPSPGKNPAAPAVRRLKEEDWRCLRCHSVIAITSFKSSTCHQQF